MHRESCVSERLARMQVLGLLALLVLSLLALLVSYDCSCVSERLERMQATLFNGITTAEKSLHPLQAQVCIQC